MKKLFLAAPMLLAGCISSLMPSEPIELDRRHAGLIQQSGSGYLEGRAMRQDKSGKTETCAGQEVYLVVATDYARARAEEFYGSETKGAVAEAKITQGEPAYHQLVRKVKCDANGNFAFSGLVNGTYYVTTSLGQGAERLSLMQIVKISGRRVRVEMKA